MYRLGNALSPVKEKESLLIDLLLRLQAEESDHRIRAVVALRFQPALGGNRRHTGGTLVCLPRRAVARPMRPHRTPCHRRANHRRFATPCGSGTASHRVRSIPANGGHKHESTDKRAKYPLDPRLKTGVCARNLYQVTRSPLRGRSNGFVAKPLADCPANLSLPIFRIDLLGQHRVGDPRR